MAKKEAPAAFVRPGDQDEKLKALEAAKLQIEKQFGKGSLMKMGDGSELVGIEVIPSGSILLDEALGVGGYPRGRMVEIYGPESSGKDHPGPARDRRVPERRRHRGIHRCGTCPGPGVCAETRREHRRALGLPAR